MATLRNPLAEIFGYPPDDLSPEAERHRRLRLCPFNNKVPSCTKDKAKDPLGVCSIRDDSGITSTCPVRFRQDWLIAEDAADFFFPRDTKWTSLTEVRLNDGNGKSAGNIDVMLVAYDADGRVIDFGALEVQAVYISGNVRRPFEAFMQNPAAHQQIDWSRQNDSPRADYLSSSRKRLAPQLIYKGGIFNAWEKKMAVAVHRSFFATLPALAEVNKEQANLAWLVYDLDRATPNTQYTLVRIRTVYTMFTNALDKITNPAPGPLEKLVQQLQKVDREMAVGASPDTPMLDNPFAQ